MVKNKIYEKIDIEKFGNEEHLTSVSITIKNMAHIKRYYKGIKDFIEKMVQLDKERKKVAKNG